MFEEHTVPLNSVKGEINGSCEGMKRGNCYTLYGIESIRATYHTARHSNTKTACIILVRSPQCKMSASLTIWE